MAPGYGAGSPGGLDQMLAFYQGVSDTTGGGLIELATHPTEALTGLALAAANGTAPGLVELLAPDLSLRAQATAFADRLRSPDPTASARAQGQLVGLVAALLLPLKGLRGARTAGGWAVETEGAGAGVVDATGSPAVLLRGRVFEGEQLSELGVTKNTTVFRPSEAQIESAAFNVVVGPGKTTPGGAPLGTIVDSLGLEVKGGSSPLGSTYQLRLQTFRALVTGEPLTIRTTRPLVPSFASWLESWGVSVDQVR